MPALPIILHGERNHVPVAGIVDSGADYSFIPLAFASTLGIDLAACKREDCNTAGGMSTQYIWQAGLDAEVQALGMNVHLKTAFSETPFVLLGREDFFEAFKISFDHRGLKFTLESYQ